MSSLFEENPKVVLDLLSVAGIDTGVLDGLYKYYGDLGYLNALEDMVYETLGDSGYSGSLATRWNAAMESGVLS